MPMFLTGHGHAEEGLHHAPGLPGGGHGDAVYARVIRHVAPDGLKGDLGLTGLAAVNTVIVLVISLRHLKQE